MLKSKCKTKLPYSYAGIAAVITLWLGLPAGLFLAHMSPFGTTPLSALGVNPHSAGMFTATLLTSAVFFIAFGVYLFRRFKLPAIYLFVFVIGHVFEIIAGIAPYGGKYKTIHTIAAFSWAVSVPVSMYIIQRSKNLGLISKACRSFWLAEVVAFIIGIGAFTRIGYALPLCQLLVAVPFHAWIIYMTLSFRQQKI